MTPFDPVALLVMLRTFYPQPSAAALRRARQERPEYFAGGEIVSTGQDKIRLPDGRIFDLIFDVDGVSGGPRWQVIEPGPAGAEDPFPLEPGALVPIDIDAELPPPLEPGFEELVAGELGGLTRDAQVIETRAGELVTAGGSERVEDVYEDTAGPGESALEGHIAAYPSLDPSDVVSTTNGVGGRIPDAQSDYPDPETTAPPDMDNDPGPRDGPPLPDAPERTE